MSNAICNWSCFCSWCWTVWKRWRKWSNGPLDGMEQIYLNVLNNKTKNRVRIIRKPFDDSSSSCESTSWWKWPSSGLFLSVTPGAISLFATPSGVTSWTVNKTLTLTCNGPVGTVEGNTQVRWLLRCCTGMFFSQIRVAVHRWIIFSVVWSCSVRSGVAGHS